MSFEYWGESNPHWKLGEGVCHVSSSCIFERSARKEKEGKGPNCNLYIKGEDIIRFDTLFSQLNHFSESKNEYVAQFIL